MKAAEIITRMVDFFYVKPLRRIIPLETFRYAVCGGINMLLGWVLYALLYKYVIRGYRPSAAAASFSVTYCRRAVRFCSITCC